MTVESSYIGCVKHVFIKIDQINAGFNYNLDYQFTKIYVIFHFLSKI